MSLDLVCSSSEPFFTVLVIILAKLNLLTFFLQFRKSTRQLVPFIGQLPHLA